MIHGLAFFMYGIFSTIAIIVMICLLFWYLRDSSLRAERREQRNEESDMRNAKREDVRYALELANYYGIDPKDAINAMNPQQPQIPMASQGYYQLPTQTHDLVIRR